MQLLVKRDITLLEKTKGKAIVDSDVPKALKTPRVVPQQIVDHTQKREPSDDLIIANERDYSFIDTYLKFGSDDLKQEVERMKNAKVKLINCKADVVPALWSGYRSALFQDPETGRLFRLKGISLNPSKPEIKEFEDDVFWVLGGQKRENADFERKMSDRCNKVLSDYGIAPTMTYRGIWQYPVKVKGEKVAASVIETLGDTRLDELMFVLDCVACKKMYIDAKSGKIGELTKEGEKIFKNLKHFYYQVGNTVGRLKCLMDESGQTWSCDSERSNAHIGNIVVYNGTDKIKIGFVDFDASCDSDDLTQSEMRDLQKREYETIMRSAQAGPISLRQTSGLPSTLKLIHTIGDFRKAFQQGFFCGYSTSPDCFGDKLTNEIDLGILQETLELLRTVQTIAKAPYLGPRINDPLENYGTRLHKNSGLEDIIDKNRSYQRRINNYGKDDDKNPYFIPRKDYLGSLINDKKPDDIYRKDNKGLYSQQ